MACPNCGSWSVRADRSLAGRMVCGRCGLPLAGRGSPGRRSRPQQRARNQPNPALTKLSPGWWGLIALLALGAGLSWLEAPPGRQDSPLPGKGLGHQNLLPQANRSPDQLGVWQPQTP
jgi:hypothetical protein